MKTALHQSCRTPVTDSPCPEGNKTNRLEVKTRIATWLMVGAACFMAGRYSVSTASQADRPAAVVAAPPATAAPVSHEPVAGAAKAHSAPATPPAWDENQWADLRAQPGTVARNRTLAALLEQLAAVDPQRALALAQAEVNLKLRDNLAQAVLHGWARTAPLEAANWANALDDASAREAAMSSVFAGAVAGDPAEAVRVGRLMMEQNAGEASGYGTRLIDALTEAGKFTEAAQLAATSETGVQRSIWLAEAFSKWSELQPLPAAQAANAMTDPQAKMEALHGVVGGWAATDPAGLTQFLVQLPAGDERGQMVGQALANWARVDPVAVANWMNAHTRELGSDLDQGMHSIATIGGIKPDLAVAWAENITAPELRSTALNDVLRNWVASDPAAARSYFDNTPNLLPADRQQISEILAGMNPPATGQ